MFSKPAIIARYTLLEAQRTRLPGTMLLVMLVLLGASFFVREIAIVEADRLQTSFYASCIRLTAVLIIAMHVLGSISREFQDKGLELLLALDVPRSHYILGRLGGFVCVAAGMAVIASVPQFVLASPGAAIQWTFSLSLELSLVAALALFGIITFTQVMPAATFVFAFYLLARTVNAIRLISEHPLVGADTSSHQVIVWVVRAMSWLLPAFDGWTRTDWLVNQPAAWNELAVIAAGFALYGGFIAVAAMLDFYRRPL